MNHLHWAPFQCVFCQVFLPGAQQLHDHYYLYHPDVVAHVNSSCVFSDNINMRRELEKFKQRAILDLVEKRVKDRLIELGLDESLVYCSPESDSPQALLPTPSPATNCSVKSDESTGSRSIMPPSFPPSPENLQPTDSFIEFQSVPKAKDEKPKRRIYPKENRVRLKDQQKGRKETNESSLSQEISHQSMYSTAYQTKKSIEGKEPPPIDLNETLQGSYTCMVCQEITYTIQGCRKHIWKHLTNLMDSYQYKCNICKFGGDKKIVGKHCYEEHKDPKALMKEAINSEKIMSRQCYGRDIMTTPVQQKRPSEDQPGTKKEDKKNGPPSEKRERKSLFI